MTPRCEYCDALRKIGYKGCPTHVREAPPDKPPDCLCVLLGVTNPGLPHEVVRRCCPACRVNSPPAGLETLRPGRNHPEGGMVPQNANKRKWGVFGGFPVPAIVRWMGADGWTLTEYRVAEDALGWPELDRKAVDDWLAEGRDYPNEVPDLSFSDESKLYKALAGEVT